MLGAIITITSPGLGTEALDRIAMQPLCTNRRQEEQRREAEQHQQNRSNNYNDGHQRGGWKGAWIIDEFIPAGLSPAEITHGQKLHSKGVKGKPRLRNKQREMILLEIVEEELELDEEELRRTFAEMEELLSTFKWHLKYIYEKAN